MQWRVYFKAKWWTLCCVDYVAYTKQNITTTTKMYKEWKEAQASEEDRARAILPGGRSHLLTLPSSLELMGLG